MNYDVLMMRLGNSDKEIWAKKVYAREGEKPEMRDTLSCMVECLKELYGVAAEEALKRLSQKYNHQ